MNVHVSRSLSLNGAMPVTLKGSFTVRSILICLSDTSKISNFGSSIPLTTASRSPVTAISQTETRNLNRHLSGKHFNLFII